MDKYKMKTKFLKQWFSLCSAHHKYQEDCSMCDTGNWVFMPAHWISGWFFRVSPGLWRWWMNLRGFRFRFVSRKSGKRVDPFPNAK